MLQEKIGFLKIFDMRYFLSLFTLLTFGLIVEAKDPPKEFLRPTAEQREQLRRVNFRSDCAPATAQTDQSINNVRARLMTGGDVWWDLQDGKYIVPKVEPGSGQLEVSSIFAGAVWLGGLDEVGNLKVAAQTYRRQTRNDFWPGPLDDDGQVNAETCETWDRFFRVLGSNIESHRAAFAEAEASGAAYEPDEIPLDVLGYPAFGNPYFREIHGFELPDARQGLAGFRDVSGNGIYDPTGGDYPIIEIRGCPDEFYADEMIFWVYNDNGGPHTSSNGIPIQMEVQVQSFAWATNDEINDMTFQRYKLINRATQDITETYFAMWVDPDLGCYADDYIGCDTTRSLMIVYNEDAVDGLVGCDCAGVPTYCTNIPILGVDYFRGPIDPENLITIFDPITEDSIEVAVELGMSSYVYHNNPGIGTPPPATTDPNTAQQFYNYLSGFWRDGTPVTFGGDGYNVGSEETIKYVFPSNAASTAADAWSMCSENLDFGDRRTIQASGPFRLEPGAVNELIIGVVWLPSQSYPCPDFAPLQFVDDIAQDLFDNCFELTDGPDAPDIDIVELNRELVLILTNDISSNNFRQQYEGTVMPLPLLEDEDGNPIDVDTLYKFEGYKVFQLRSSDVSASELTDPDKARLIYQVDLQNEIDQIYNWVPVEDPTGLTSRIYVPRLMVDGENRGVRNTFVVREDQFADDDRNLINHKRYYFMAVAYAHNNFEQFDPSDPTNLNAQLEPYLEGRRNVRSYVGIPRPITSMYLNADYGDGPTITRLDGQGNAGNFLDMEDHMYDRILSGEFDGEIDYKLGGGPLDIKVINPIEVTNGEFEITFFNPDNKEGVDGNTRWVLRDVETGNEVFSDFSLERLNEQVLQDYGVSISMYMPDTLGIRADDVNGPADNGTVGATVEFADMEGEMWFAGIPRSNNSILFDQLQPLNYIKNGPGQPDAGLDPTQRLHRIGNGFFAPLYIMDYRPADSPLDFMVSPMLINNTAAGLRSRVKPSSINNVDIVFTADKDKWSRCVVVQTANNSYSATGFAPTDNTNMFDYRDHPSIDKNGNYATSDGSKDGTPLTGSSENPNDANYISEKGMGWFPGYAIDVTTGERLNIFFGENSVFDDRFLDEYDNEMANGDDMIWNPTSQLFLNEERLVGEDGFPVLEPVFFFYGGQHFVYVTRQKYDGCEQIINFLTPRRNPLTKARAFEQLTWAGFPILNEGTELLSYQDGLIPNEVRLKLRVSQQFAQSETEWENAGLPKYRVSLRGLAPDDLDEPGIENFLDQVNVVPNPYYGYSAYEINQFTNTVKITNLPDKCTVTIYTLDGKFIRQFRRDESPGVNTGSNPGTRTNQVVPALEWDLRNDKLIPVASGVYLIHIDAGPLGERVLKWFGVNRQFDPSGL